MAVTQNAKKKQCTVLPHYYVVKIDHNYFHAHADVLNTSAVSDYYSC